MNKYVLLLAFSVSLIGNRGFCEQQDFNSDPLYEVANSWLSLDDDSYFRRETKELDESQHVDSFQERLEELQEEEQDANCGECEKTACLKCSGTVAKEEDKGIFGKKVKLPRFMERIKNLLFKSDPLGSFRKNKRKKKSYFRPIHLRLSKFDGFKRRVSNTTSYVRRVSDNETLSIGVSYVPLELRGNFSNMKMDSFDLSVGYRQYFGERWFYQVNGGVKRYNPNEGYRQFFAARNQIFDPGHIPYLTVGVGRRIIKKLPIIKRPMVLTTSYTLADDLNYPSTDPLGYSKIDLSGFSVGVSVRFSI